jgi:RimJ/RimL family protein N-acetyltransferase
MTMSQLPPSIDTERLTLRQHQREDFAETAALWGDPEVTRYVGGKPLTAEEVWTRLLRHIGHWSLLGFGYWVAREKSSGRFVGEVGFADLKRALDPPFDGAPEAGWILAPWSHGRGYATEAVRAAIDWGSRHFGPVRTVCLIDDENVRSIRVAEKCGYREYARTTYKANPVILFER